MKKLLASVFILVMAYAANGQVVYEDINNTGIYEFLDELATLRIITLNSAIKPYSRQYIATKLRDAETSDTAAAVPGKKVHRLNERQRKELHFYLQDYQLDVRGESAGGRRQEAGGRGQLADTMRHTTLSESYDYKLGFLFKKQENMALALNPVGFHYRDSLFTFSLRPILGMQWMSNNNGTVSRKWWGGSMFGYIGKNFGFYANLRDNNESTPMAKPAYFTLAQGEVYKAGSQGGVDFSEMRGGIVASVKWGSLGIMNDRIAWGDNYHGANILSGKAPAFPYIQLHLNPVKWFDFNYIHGWLSSGVVDSSRSYYSGDVYRIVYRNKFIAANMFTFIPWRGLNLSFGNSIIYSDISVNPLYLIPFLFYNAVDASRTNYVDYAGSNSQLFFNVSSRQIRHLHLFATLFVDEWKTKRVTDPNTSNFTSLKAGFSLDGFPLANLALAAEYTRTMPMTYDHYMPTTTFRSNEYSLGHYLRENSQEIYIALSYRPLRGFVVNASYTLAQHGDQVPYVINGGYPVDGIPFMQNKTWQNSAFGLSARYEYASNGYFFVSYLYSDRSGSNPQAYQPAIMDGMTNSFQVGISLGF